MVRDYLDSDILHIMDIYRERYATDDARNGVKCVPSEEVLSEWEIQKQRGNLFRLFGNELIKSKKISYETPNFMLCDKMWYATHTHEGYDTTDADEVQREVKSGKEFFDAFSAYISKEYGRKSYIDFNSEAEYRENRSILYDFQDMINETSLVKNKYSGEPHIIPLGEGHNMNIVHGMKITRILGKLAEAWNLPGYEDFRLRHSQVLNQSKISGELCLSIHTLDYMTMSDNDSGWESCMSWMQHGDYRQGTVEMMNSPCVVVGYLKRSKDMRLFWTRDEDKSAIRWTNKKWRCLFIVDKNIITSIKDYPYHNEELDIECVKWLKELAQTQLGWQYEDDIKAFKYKHDGLCEFDDESEDYIRIWTNHMYNDFGAGYEHWCCKGTEFNSSPQTPFILEYSGPSQCMICGEVADNFDGSYYLSCEYCSDITYCSECGERINHDGDIYWVDGKPYCYDCYYDQFDVCSECNDSVRNDDAIHVFMVPRLEDGWHYEPTTSDGSFYRTLCTDKNCMDNFIRNTLKDGATLHTCKNSCCNNYYFYMDELRDDDTIKSNWLSYNYEVDGPDIEKTKRYYEDYVSVIESCEITYLK